jgi:nucleotide-binding universal stress UspA family protein
MKKILIPIDFSGHTEITCAYAVELSRSGGVELRLFHSYFDQIIIADSSFPDAIDMSTMYNEELLKEIFHHAERNMQELKEKLEQDFTRRKLQDISVSITVTGGEIEHELMELYRDFKPDLVVVGSTGMGQNLNVWGKVSTYIINHSQVPVMAIPEIQRFLGFGRIMLSADLSEENASSMRQIMDLFQPFSSKFFCVHFLSKTKQKDEKEKMKLLRKQFEAEEQSGLVTFEIREVEEDNQKTIDQFVKDFAIEMIVFQPYKHGILYRLFTKNITKKNLFATNIPLLAIPVNPAH